MTFNSLAKREAQQLRSKLPLKTFKIQWSEALTKQLTNKNTFYFFFPSSNFSELENAKQNIYIGENRRDRAFFYIHFSGS